MTPADLVLQPVLSRVALWGRLPSVEAPITDENGSYQR